MKRPLAGLSALALSFAVLVTVACATGTVQTQYGPRPAAEVQVQDTVGDVLISLQAAYTAAVAIHDDPATVTADGPVVHAAHRATLITQHDALLASWNALLLSKQAAGSGYDPVAIVRPLVGALPSFLALAVDLKVLSSDAAAKILSGVKVFFPAMSYMKPSHRPEYTQMRWIRRIA